MTDKVTILRCGLCGKPFSYVPQLTDKCAPGSKNQICDGCAERLIAEGAYFDGQEQQAEQS